MTASAIQPDGGYAANEHATNGAEAGAAHQHRLGPTTAGTVVLDIGHGVGALVVITGPEWRGREIEISPRDREPAVRTHVAVRERQMSDGVRYAAVFPALPAGPYVLWRGPGEPAGTVLVAPATVTELEWWARP